ncbi:MAG: adenylate/guanylate cyclase domain-containing protein [Chloroflexi bacterium]|nr:adenylate/guanylate cyclase domain-containing protein [Chloroflexota bacterium]
MPKALVRQILRRNSRVLTGLVIASGVGAVFCLAFALNLLSTLQSQSDDFFFQAAEYGSESTSADKIVVIAIDEDSLARLGRISSWSRTYYAQVIDKLSKAGARLIVFDVLFSEPAAGDTELATSIQRSGKVILPFIRAPEQSGATLLRATTGTKNFIKPLELFSNHALALGHANVTPDRDGVVRKVSIVLSENGSEPALALAAAAKYLRRPEVIESPPQNSALPFAGRTIPLSGSDEMLVNYIDSPRRFGEVVSFQTVSFIRVLNDEANLNLFEDKIALIGVTASGLGDTFLTPMGVMFSGVEIHATAIHTILQANFLKQPPSWLTVLLILIFALATGLLATRLRALFAVLASGGLLVSYLLAAFTLFERGIMLNLLYPPLATVASFAAVTFGNVVVERSEKRKLLETFGRYLSPSIRDKILATMAEGELKLGGEEQEVTVLFADARGFTNMSETVPPHELVIALNTHLSLIIGAILAQDGSVNKFGGDSVMAIWNAPVPSERHRLRAVKAALSAQEKIRELAGQESNIPGMKFGMGINTGKALVGNMGSAERLEYTVIGDAVNTAARLANAAPGGTVWIGANTLTQIKELVEIQSIGTISIKGKQEPVPAYEVLRLRDQEVSK